MHRIDIKKRLHVGLYLLGALSLATSCVDKDFDLTKDIDMTMGFGSDGLSVKLGSTDKVLLKDILEEGDNTKTDTENRYYLIEDGNIEMEFETKSLALSIGKGRLSTTPFITFETAKAKWPTSTATVTVPANDDLKGTGQSVAQANMSVEFKYIDTQIIGFSKAFPRNASAHVYLNVIQPANLGFKVNTVHELRITLPRTFELDRDRLDAGTEIIGNAPDTTLVFHQLSYVEGQPVCSIPVKAFRLTKDEVPVQVGEDRQIVLDKENTKIQIQGELGFSTGSRGFTMNEKDEVGITAEVTFANNPTTSFIKLDVDQLLGKLSPQIRTNVDPIDIALSLPDFMKDNKVYMDVVNPTMKFVSDFTHNSYQNDVPFNIHFSGRLLAQKPNVKYNEVLIPHSELVIMKENLLYFSQQEEPYDPSGIGQGSVQQQIGNLSDLLKPQIPNRITMMMENNDVYADQSKEYMVKLNRFFSPDMKYEIIVPFTFDKEFSIVYRDSTESFGSDLKNVSGKGVTVTTDVHTLIPLNLTITAEPVTVDGRVVELLDEATAHVPSCQSGNEESHKIELKMNLKNPSELSKVDHVRFLVNADAQQNDGPKDLKSNQYLFMQDVRVHLNGQIIVDFN